MLNVLKVLTKINHVRYDHASPRDFTFLYRNDDTGDAKTS